MIERTQLQNQAQTAIGATHVAIPNDGMPRLRIRLEDGMGKQLGEPIEIRIPRELSLRVAKMYLLEMVVKLIKAALPTALPTALKEMGFK